MCEKPSACVLVGLIPAELSHCAVLSALAGPKPSRAVCGPAVGCGKVFFLLVPDMAPSLQKYFIATVLGEKHPA